MPTKSVRERIMQQVEATIRAITAGASYFTTFALVERMRENPLDKEVYPQVSIAEGQATYDITGLQDQTPLTLASLDVVSVRLPVELWFADRTTTQSRSTVANHILQNL